MPDELEALVAGEVGDVVRASGDEVVQPDHVVPLAQEAFGEVRPEEAGGSGDEDAHQRGRPMQSYTKPSAAHLGGVVEVAPVDHHRRGAASP